MAKIYALYQGDEFVAVGTIKEISETIGINEDSVRFYGTPSHKKHANEDKSRWLICLDDEDEDEYEKEEKKKEPSKTRRTLAENVKRLREKTGLSKTTLSKIAGNKNGTVIGRIENCEMNATIASLEKIAAALEVDVFELVKESEEDEHEKDSK